MNVMYNGQQYELVRYSGDLALIRSDRTVLCVAARELTAEPEKPAAKKKTKSAQQVSPRSDAKN